MPYRCLSPESYEGIKIGSGQCVEFVQKCTVAPLTSSWQKGPIVKGNISISRGTAIATFNAAGKYPNHSTGNHAAVYLGQDSTGIWVYDQWVAKGFVSKRHIRFKGTPGMSSNDGDDYFVIE